MDRKREITLDQSEEKKKKRIEKTYQRTEMGKKKLRCGSVLLYTEEK